ncbi:MAG: hypothetical protein LBR87_07045 [Synergistaceae bacterium]|jgi:hypothetical protein|nr:hypothetical protein [Synergistaceae bacterium]
MYIPRGYPFYGQNIGVLVLSGTSPRVPGDAGHSATFRYPVRYEVLDAGFIDLVTGGPAVRQNIIDACLRLKGFGIRGVLGDCGLMSLYQDEIGAVTGLPFVGSSLCQIPVVWQMIGRSGSIGVLTGHAEMLGGRHLKNSGWNEDMKLSVQGMQDEPHFAEIVIEGAGELDVNRMRLDVLNASRKLAAKTPSLRALILECSNLAAYSADLAEALGVPVFDTISAANLLAYSVDPDRYL